MAITRRYTCCDRLLMEADHFLRILLLKSPATKRSPAASVAESTLTDRERQHVAGCMRVNHTGEICAQALYRGQAFVARDAQSREMLHHAAIEEQDHLAWCDQRLQELHSHPSRLNIGWYLASFKIGLLAALCGDKWSMGFVEETEQQVIRHLEDHLNHIPMSDGKTRAILQRMRADELRHAEVAHQLGAGVLPHWAKLLMTLHSKVMTSLAYRF